MRLGRLAHDREAEARARQAARAVRPVEALEHAREVAVGEARPVVADAQRAVGERQLHRAAGRAPLDRVVDQVRHGPVDAPRVSPHHGRLRPHAELDAVPRSRPRALDDGLHDLVQAHLAGQLARRRAARELHHVGHEGGQLVELGDHVRPQRLALVGRQAVGLPQRLDVGAQAGDRRAQLVAGVGHELALCLDRPLERVERGVEAARQPGELLPSPDLHPLRGIGIGGELLGPPCEPVDRGQRRACHERTQSGAERHASRAHEQEHQQDAVELAVDLVERPGHLERAGVRERLGEHAQVDAVDRRVGEVAARAVRRDLARPLVHRKLPLAAGPAERPAVRQHELHVPLGAAEGLGPRTRQAGRPVRAPAREAFGPAEADDRLRAVAKRLVHLAAQLVAHADVDGDRHGDHRERYRQPRRRRDAGAQRHGSRST